jgi:hypothetical protein
MTALMECLKNFVVDCSYEIHVSPSVARGLITRNTQDDMTKLQASILRDDNASSYCILVDP